MASDRRHAPPAHPHQSSISEQAATAAQAAAHRARDGTSRLVRAREARGFTLGREKQDVRGWQVLSRDGERVGVVTSLFVDMRTRAIRYLGVALDGPNGRTTTEVLVPIGCASRPDDRQLVVVHAVTREQLVAAPHVPRRPITRADEQATLSAYGISSASSPAEELYHGPMFDEWRVFGGPGSRAALG